MLGELEWSGGELQEIGSGWCPICAMQSSDGHKPECLLGKIIELNG
jgi:hypothetical protein